MNQITLQRDLRSPYWTPITSPTFNSCSNPENSAPELLILRARTCWEKAWPPAAIPHTRTERSAVMRGAGRVSLMATTHDVGSAYHSVTSPERQLPKLPGWFVRR